MSKEKLAFSASSPKSVAKNDAFGFSFREGCTLGVDYDSGKKDKDGALVPSCLALQCATRLERVRLARSLKKICDDAGVAGVGGDVASLRMVPPQRLLRSCRRCGQSQGLACHRQTQRH